MTIESDRIYADANAGAFLAPAVRSFLDKLRMSQYWHNPSSAHIDGQRSRNLLETAREDIAEVLHVEPARLMFTSGGSESILTAMWAITNDLNSPTEIQVSTTDHPVARKVAAMLERKGLVQLQLVQPNAFGIPEKSHANVGSLTHVQAAHSELGTVLPTAWLKENRSHTSLIHIDACQALGKVSLAGYFDYADFLSLSGHKVGSPAGIGLLYVRDGLDNLQALIPGEQEWKRRGGTENLLGALALAEAVKARLQRDRFQEQTREWVRLLHLFEQALSTGIPDLDILSPPIEQRLPQTSFFRIPGLRSHNVVVAMDRRHISISSGTACRSGLVSPNETAIALGYSHAESTETIRVSFDWDVQESDVLRVASALIELAKKRH